MSLSLCVLRDKADIAVGSRYVKYLLQGLAQCACCGYAYYGKKVSRASAKGRVSYVVVSAPMRIYTALVTHRRFGNLK